MRFVIGFLLLSMVFGCVTGTPSPDQTELDAEFNAMIPKVRQWHVECHEKGIADSCMAGAGFAMKFGRSDERFKIEAFKDLSEACKLGSEVGCFERDRLKARILREDAYAEQDFRESLRRQKDNDNALIEMLMKNANQMGTINSAPAVAPQFPIQRKQTVRCVEKSNFGRMETVCTEE